MKFSKSTSLDVIRTLLGLAFIISGIAKALDSGKFGELLLSYGFEQLYLLAPVVVLVELLLGLSLFLGVYTKLSSAAMAIALIVFTGVYTYGHLAYGISNCGCYGRIGFLESSPTMVYIRNLMLLCGALWVYSQSEWSFKPVHISFFYSAIVFALAGAYACGYTFSHRSTLKQTQSQANFEPIALSAHDLRNFIDVSADSTYLVSVFSYSCPHCINTMGNVEQYQRLHYVDRVIGIGVDVGDEDSTFRKVFNPPFEVMDFDSEQISELTSEFPVSYFISNDTIRMMIKGELPSVYFFMINDINEERARN